MYAAAKIESGRYHATKDDSFESSFFNAAEMQCRCGECPQADVAQGLIDLLNHIRKQTLAPLHIQSGIRCAVHNRAVQGSPKSFHVPEFHAGLGMAADVNSRRASHVMVAMIAARWLGAGRGGVKIYPSWVHVDVRATPWTDEA